MELAILSLPAGTAGEIERVHQMMEEGMECFHLRKPEFSRMEMESWIQEIDSQYRNRLVVHSHHELAGEYGLKGGHFSSSVSKVPAGCRQMSVSCHSIRELHECRISFDYAFLSPIFDSISKQGYRSHFSEEELREFLHSTDRRVFALGGIDEQNIDKIRDLGFAGAAVLGALWQSEDPVEKFKRLNERCRT